MLKTLIAALSGGSGIWVLIGGLAGAGVAGGAVGYMARGVIDAPAFARQETATAKAEKATEACERRHETARAEGNAKVTQELQRQVQALGIVINDLEKKKVARDVADRKFLDELGRLAESKVCGGSLPERLYRNSVQPSGRAPAVP